MEVTVCLDSDSVDFFFCIFCECNEEAKCLLHTYSQTEVFVPGTDWVQLSYLSINLFWVLLGQI